MADNRSNTSAPYVYPSFECIRDLGFARVAGAGLGNCLIEYFHAVIHANETGAKILAPAWPSIKIGPILRGERSKRTYIGLFRPAPGEISGLAKAFALLRVFVPGRTWSSVPVMAPGHAKTNGLITLAGCRTYTFNALKPWRAMIRERFLQISVPKLPLDKGWGNGDYVAVHVRLGDFAAATAEQLASGTVNNIRIPLDWYVDVVKQLRAVFPELAVHVFSDGKEEELAPVLSIDGVSIRREDNDLADLAALAGAKLLVGSQSTYSRWGAFLGNMPSIWLATAKEGERYSDDHVPVLRVGDDVSVITREALFGS